MKKKEIMKRFVWADLAVSFWISLAWGVFGAMSSKFNGQLAIAANDRHSRRSSDLETLGELLCNIRLNPHMTATPGGRVRRAVKRRQTALPS